MNVVRSFWFRLLVIIVFDALLVATTTFTMIVKTQLPRIPDNLENLNPQSGANINIEYA